MFKHFGKKDNFKELIMELLNHGYRIANFNDNPQFIDLEKGSGDGWFEKHSLNLGFTKYKEETLIRQNDLNLEENIRYRPIHW